MYVILIIIEAIFFIEAMLRVFWVAFLERPSQDTDDWLLFVNELACCGMQYINIS